MRIKLHISHKFTQSANTKFECDSTVFGVRFEKLVADGYDSNKVLSIGVITQLSEKEITALKSVLAADLPLDILLFDGIPYDEKMGELLTEVFRKYGAPQLKIVNSLFFNTPRQLQIMYHGNERILWYPTQQRLPYQHEIDCEIFVCANQLTMLQMQEPATRGNDYNAALNEASEMYGFLRFIKSTEPLNPQHDYYAKIDMDIDEEEGDDAEETSSPNPPYFGS